MEEEDACSQHPEYKRYLEVLQEEGLTDSLDDLHRYRWAPRAERDLKCRNWKREREGRPHPFLFFAEDKHIPKFRWATMAKENSNGKRWCTATVPVWVDYLLSLPLEHEVPPQPSPTSDSQDKDLPTLTPTTTPTETKERGDQEVAEQKKQDSERGGKGKRGGRGGRGKGGNRRGGGGGNGAERRRQQKKEKKPPKVWPDTGESRRHGYSVISESAPCFGFIDAEFDATLNEGRSLPRMLNTFISYYSLAWKQLFAESYPGLPVPTIKDFLVIDASNSSKGSKHVHGPFYFAFRNVYHQAAFMHHVWNMILAVANQQIDESDEKAREERDRARECIVKVKLLSGIVERPFVDLPVYSHNRCFRMYSCCKGGSNRGLFQDPDFPISAADIPGIPKEAGESQERAILTHTIIDAEVYPYLRPEGEASKEGALTVLDFPNETGIKKILPRNAFNRKEPATKTKKSRFVLSLGTKADEKDGTHFEQAVRSREAGSSIVQLYYTLKWPEDKLRLEKEVTKSMTHGYNYHTFETLCAVTKLMLEVTLTKATEEHLAVRTDKEKVMREEIIPKELSHIQRVLSSLLSAEEEGKEKEEEKMECFLLKEGDSHFRLLWPNLFVEKEKGEQLVERLKKLLKEEAPTESLQAIDIAGGIYQRGCSPLLGATPLTPLPSGQTASTYKLLGIFTKEGAEAMQGEVRKKVNLAPLDAFRATSNFNDNEWHPSKWKDL